MASSPDETPTTPSSPQAFAMGTIGGAIRPVPPGSRGFDSVEIPTAEQFRAFRQAGYEFWIPYLDTLTPGIIADGLAAGLGMLACHYSRKPGWQPTPALGDADGVWMVQKARSLGIPPGLALSIDFEGPDPATTKDNARGYLEAAAARIVAGGFPMMLYGGYRIILDGRELAALLDVTLYWRSCSKVPDDMPYEWCVKQVRPANIRVLGLQVDIDFVEEDFHSPPRTPPALWAA